MDNQLLKTGGFILTKENRAQFHFPDKRFVLSTAQDQGGYCSVRSVTYEQSKLQPTCLLGTRKNSSAVNLLLQGSASIDNQGYSCLSWHPQSIEVVIIADVGENAIRAGETYNKKQADLSGGIFIFAFIPAKVSKGDMAKLLLTVTEAKTAVLQELAIVSPYEGMPATGTYDDEVVLVTNPQNDVLDTVSFAAAKSVVAQAVKQALKDSLALGSRMSPWRQSMIEERLWRLGFENICSADLPNETTKTQVLLSFCQSVWLEYCWGLIGIDGLYQFFSFLESPLFAPNGLSLSRAFRQKISAQMEDGNQSKTE